MASDIDLISVACGELGADPISARNSETDIGRQASIVYAELVDYLLSVYPWRFQVEQAELTRSGTKPHGWRYAFLLPANRRSDQVIRLRNGSEEHAPNIVNFSVQSGKVFCNHERVFAEYQAVRTAGNFPPYFADLVRAGLKARLAYFITGSSTEAARCREEFQGTPSEQGWGGAMGQAMATDSMGAGQRDIYSGDLIDARFGGWSRGDGVF